MAEPTVALVDAGGANIASLRFALRRLGRDSVFTADADVIHGASHVILPGVGAAADAMSRLRANGLDRLLPTLTQPVLGICLGMQLLFDGSDEDDTPCLGIIGGQVRRLRQSADLPVPHMGWNSLRLRKRHPLLAEIADGAHVYFVHSYAVDVDACTLASTDYGIEFSAVVGQRNFLGTQFHPERSGRVGERLLRNFLALQTSCN